MWVLKRNVKRGKGQSHMLENKLVSVRKILGSGNDHILLLPVALGFLCMVFTDRFPFLERPIGSNYASKGLISTILLPVRAQLLFQTPKIKMV